MRILILANNDVGLYQFRRELLEALIVQGNEVHVSLPAGQRVSAIEELGCHVHITEIERRGTNPIKDLALMSNYRKLIKKICPAIVFTYTIKPNVYGGMACAMMKVPYVANITGLGTAVENGGIMQKITLALYRLGLRKAQKIFFQNTENREFLLSRGVVKGAYDLLPGSGVNLQRYQTLPYPGGDTVDFVFIARIMKEKGIDQYLDAARYIREKYPQTRFHICGACEEAYEQALKDLHNNGTVIYHGQVSDMIAIHRICQCTIHPTYYPEGLSNVLLESAACGRPLITTNRSGCRRSLTKASTASLCSRKIPRILLKRSKNSWRCLWKRGRLWALPAEQRSSGNLTAKSL